MATKEPPQTQHMEILSVYMPSEVRAKVKALADADRRSDSSWALIAIEEKLERIEQAD